MAGHFSGDSVISIDTSRPIEDAAEQYCEEQCKFVRGSLEYGSCVVCLSDLYQCLETPRWVLIAAVVSGLLAVFASTFFCCCAKPDMKRQYGTGI